MIDDIFAKRPKRHIQDLNIVPILDMFTTIIFFLLLSTGFLEYTKLTVPPSKVSTITDPVVPPPLAPKIILAKTKREELRLFMFWSGENPGEVSETFKPLDERERRQAILRISDKFARDFSAKYPKEKSLQVGLGSKLPYQDLISVMDGVRDVMSDLVLISHHEADARAAGTEPDPELPTRASTGKKSTEQGTNG
ncbi:MAG TPA: biopolymer transporter ExbD [Bdellovibrionota bacterium]|nr:biopolymer transporter ExbD [Bdellovibrionota bacterium]